MIGPEFDFEKMARLSRSDPDAAKQYRDELIAKAIAAAPPESQAKLRDFQRTIDLEVSCYDDPAETAKALLQRVANHIAKSNEEFLGIGKLVKEIREKLPFSDGTTGR